MPFDEARSYWIDSGSDDRACKILGPGIIIGYHDELPKTDKVTVPSVVRRFFYGCLGHDEEEAAQNYADIQQAWGVLAKSSFGNRLTHLFKCIEIALEMQTTVQPIIVKGNYAGCVLQGAAWHLTINGRHYNPYPLEDLKKGLLKVDGHANALWAIFQKISFLTPEDRSEAWKKCNSTQKLYEYTNALGVGGTENQDAVLKLARFLSFDNEKPLTATANNIELALQYIADGTKNILDLPYLHPSMLFTTNRRHLVWSAFGDAAPSFRIDSGRRMLLTKPLEIVLPKSATGAPEKKNINKIAANIVVLPLAIKHLDETFNDKTIWNPHGNAGVGQSVNNMYRTYEGDSCQKIVTAFRKAMKISISSESGAGKRKNDDDLGGAQKKRREDMYDF